MLAQLGYLPLKWKPQNPNALQPDNVATELSAMYSPPAGTFTWKRGYPSILTSFWGGQSSLIMQGAIRAFQSNDGLTMTGVMTPALWRRRGPGRGRRAQANPHGYTYALASKAQPGDADRVAQRAGDPAHPGQHRHPGRADRGRHLPGVPALHRSRS